MEAFFTALAILLGIMYLLFFFGLFRYIFWAIATPTLGLFFKEKNQELEPKKLDKCWLKERQAIMNGKS